MGHNNTAYDQAKLPERTAVSRHFLMCPPQYFAIEYSINPWMDPARPMDAATAIAQWKALKQTYERLGHKVDLIEPQPGLPDMVFSANAAIVVAGEALGARFRAPQRAPEAEHYHRWLTNNGFPHTVAPRHINEGEGDFVWTGSLLLAGTGFRTDPGGHQQAQDALSVPVISLRLVDPRYYHLDVALCVLDDRTGLVAYYPEAFSPSSQQVLRRLFSDAVIVSEADASCLGLNAVSDGRNVILPTEAVGFAESVSRLGFEPVFVDISELRKSGGGPKCCTLELRS